MPLEIERKFLAGSDARREQVVRSERIVDGLLATSMGRKVRVVLEKTCVSGAQTETTVSSTFKSLHF